MMKKIVAVLLIICILGTFASCDLFTQGAAQVGFEFVSAIVAGDYGAAYDCCYQNSQDIGTREEFVKRYENIFSALKITQVELNQREVEKFGEFYTMTYTLDFTSDLMGSFSYDYSADIMPDISGYSVEYDPSLILPYLESGDTVQVTTLKGNRGEIFAQDKVLLAQNSFAQTLYVQLDQVEDIASVIAQANGIVGFDTQKAQKACDAAAEQGQDLATLATFARDTLSDTQKTALCAIEGVHIDETSLTPMRYYPMQDAFAHLVGYVGSPTQEDLEADETLKESDTIGKAGLEKIYDERLRGRDGLKIYVRNSAGKEKQVIYEKSAQDGEDITLSIDADLQNEAYTQLVLNLTETQSGCAIVLNYKTGEVETQVSCPSFDPNSLLFGISDELWEYLQSPEAMSPMFDRTTQAVYPPGSTFKPFSVVPALESGKITPETVPQLDIRDNSWIPDSSIPNVDHWVYPSINRVEETLGEFNMINALKSSDNIFFAYTALITGIDDFFSYLDKIGIGEAPDYELPLKTSSYLNEDTEMDIQILATTGYGMGQLEITPMQLACMYTAFFNSGDILNPTVVKRMAQQQGDDYVTTYENTVSVFKEDIMTDETISTMKDAMRLVVTNGTAYPVNIAGLDIIGKTGTATLAAEGENSREVNWVVLMNRDEENPRLVLVMIDTKADEGDAKFAVARALIKPEGFSEDVQEEEPEQ